jgi:uncharacterized protein
MRITKTVMIFLMMGISALHAQTAKVVYDLTSGDNAKIEKHLIKSMNALFDYYEKEKIEFQVIVVISGDAYKYFVDNLKESPYADDKDILLAQNKFKMPLFELADKKHITFNMCSAGMKARKIKKDTLYQYVHADVMKSVYLIKAQNDGYAYMPIH